MKSGSDMLISCGHTGNSDDGELPGRQESGGRGTQLQTAAARTTPGAEDIRSDRATGGENLGRPPESVPVPDMASQLAPPQFPVASPQVLTHAPAPATPSRRSTHSAESPGRPIQWSHHNSCAQAPIPVETAGIPQKQYTQGSSETEPV